MENVFFQMLNQRPLLTHNVQWHNAHNIVHARDNVIELSLPPLSVSYT